MSKRPILSFLDKVLALNRDPSDFQNDDLLSFAHLSSSFVECNLAFKTGRTVCDRIADFFVALRIKAFDFFRQNPSKVLSGDESPPTRWDLAETPLPSR